MVAVLIHTLIVITMNKSRGKLSEVKKVIVNNFVCRFESLIFFKSKKKTQQNEEIFSLV